MNPQASQPIQRSQTARLPLIFGILVLSACGRSPIVTSVSPSEYALLETWQVPLNATSGLTEIPPTPSPQAGGTDEAADQPAAPGTIDLQRCIALAFARNRDFRIALSQLERADIQQTRAHAQVHAPELNVAYTLSDGDDTADARIDLETTWQGFSITPYMELDYSRNGNGADIDQHDPAIGINIGRRLFSLHERERLEFGITEARVSYRQELNNLMLDSRELQLDALRAFLNVQRAQASLEVRRKRRDNARDFLRDVIVNVEAGLKAEVERTNAEINLNEAEADLLEEETNLQSTLEDLLNLLGYELTAEIAIEPIEINLDDAVVPDLDSDLPFILAHHESLANRALSIQLLEREVDFAVDQLRPRVTASFNAEQRYSDDGFLGDDDLDEGVISLGLSWNYDLDGDRDLRGAAIQTRHRLTEQRLSLDQARIDLEARTRGVQRRIAQLIRNVELSRQRVAAEEAKLAATQSRYEAGDIDNLEVTRSIESLDNARISLLNASINLVISRAEYRALLPPREPAP